MQKEESNQAEYQSVMTMLLQYIQSEGLRPGDRLHISERRLSQLWNVGRMTVNMATNCLIAQGVLRRDGYRLFLTDAPDKPRPVGQPHHDVCHLLASNDGDFLSGCTETASQLGTQCLPTVCHVDNVREQIQRALAEDTQGMILWMHVITDIRPELDELRKRNVPLVLCNLQVEGYDYVGTNDESGLDQGVQHLSQRGHRQMAYVTWDLDNSSANNRRKGYQDACARLGLADSRDRIYRCGQSVDEIRDVYLRVRREAPEVTGVLFSNLPFARGFRQICEEDGLRVPQDLSLVGYDRGVGEDRLFTTVEQDIYQIGSIAANRLVQLKRLRRQHPSAWPPRPISVQVAPHLMVGTTTASPRRT